MLKKVKVKIIYLNEVTVTNIELGYRYEQLRCDIQQICALADYNQFSIKWIDDEGDPCMITTQIELDEALRLYDANKDESMIVHVFPGLPPAPGMACQGEDNKVYRNGAKRWKKFYHLHGHKFSPKRFNKNAICFYCKDRIWGLGQQGFRCCTCRLLLHKRCQHLVKHQCGDDYESPVTTLTKSKLLLIDNTDHSDHSGTEHPGFSVEPPISSDGSSGDRKGKISITDFTLLCVVGRGSYAKVFQAEYKPTKKVYAMKVIKKESITDSDDIEWVQTEKHVFECASNHPFLVGLHSCFQTPSRLIYVIEFVNGGDLMYHMQRKLRLPEEHARFYSAEIALALNFLHSRAIIYRDIKLDNVLMDQDGHMKLTDYGMCKEGITGEIRTNTFCGTPNYIAPEILRNEAYGASVDWWSLGVLIFEMLAGCSPWILPGQDTQGDQNSEDYLFNLIMTKPIRIPRNLSVKANSLLKSLLNKDPLQRLACEPHSNFKEFQNHLFFRGLNWLDLEDKKIPPPFRPEINHDRDLSNFDNLFTDEPVLFTPDDPKKINKIDQSEFEGFEYINPLLLTPEEVV